MMADREASAVEARAEAQRAYKEAEESAAHAAQWEAQVQAIAEEVRPPETPLDRRGFKSRKEHKMW